MYSENECNIFQIMNISMVLGNSLMDGFDADIHEAVQEKASFLQPCVFT